MAAKIIDGYKISAQILASIKKQVDKQSEKPGLVTILVGDHPASLSYVRMKIKKAQELGYYDIQEHLDIATTERRLIEIIEKYNQQDVIHGILLQLPLPSHIDSQKVLSYIAPHKDVDGLHPYNLGNLLSCYKPENLNPCTPAGIMEIFRYMKIPTAGKHAVVIGRSSLVGKPIATMLSQSGHGGNATVTVVHSKSRNLSELIQKAEILIVAAGRPGLVRGKDLKHGVVVIDVGVNRIGEKTNLKGKVIPLLTGDIQFEEAVEKASYITPVPGGVGPITIAMLMQNTYLSFKKSIL